MECVIGFAVLACGCCEEFTYVSFDVGASDSAGAGDD